MIPLYLSWSEWRKERERGRRKKDGCKEGIVAKRGRKKRGRTKEIVDQAEVSGLYVRVCV